MYDLKYHYYLNHNYGKVTIESTLARDAVGIVAEDGRLEHKIFDGEVEYGNATAIDHNEVGYLTHFFGSPGYRVNDLVSWEFISSPDYLVALIIRSKCYVVLKNDKPYVCAPNDPLYANVHGRVSSHPYSKIGDNVVSLSAFKSRQSRS